MEMLYQIIARIVYFVRGWKFEPLPDYWCEKCIIIGFPHREIMDTVMAFGGYKLIGIKGHILIKKSWFVWPMSLFLRSLGGIGVDRNSPKGVVGTMVDEFDRNETFHLALVPEGTRKNVAKLRTGFWHIAKGADVPIICWFLDAKNKSTRWVGWLKASDDFDADLWKIHAIYQDAGFEIPMEGIGPSTKANEAE